LRPNDSKGGKSPAQILEEPGLNPDVLLLPPPISMPCLENRPPWVNIYLLTPKKQHWTSHWNFDILHYIAQNRNGCVRENILYKKRLLAI